MFHIFITAHIRLLLYEEHIYLQTAVEHLSEAEWLLVPAI